MNRAGRTLEQLAELVEALIVTLGSQGSRIYAGGKCIEIPAVQPGAVLDPTGCGDAYRAGLLYGIAHGWKWKKIGQLASLMGAIKIASRGPQNHKLVRADIAQRYYQAFGEEL
jgi:adenosine kinase